MSEQNLLTIITGNENKSDAHHQLNLFMTKVQYTPYKFDLFSLLRKLEVLGVSSQPLGKTAKLKSEKIRLKQEPTLAFAPTPIHGINQTKNGAMEISIYGYGLFGPNGPMPLHITEYVYERKHHFHDQAMADFSDIFHHRAISLFYRAWSGAQSISSLDGYDHWTFSRYLGSLIHVGSSSFQNRDSVSDYAKYYFAGHLLTNRRPAGGLEQILRKYFGISVKLKEFVGRWINLSEEFCARLSGEPNKILGDFPVLGTRIYDIQTKFRLVLGPLNWQEYCSFFPNQSNAQRLLDWVKFYTNLEVDWDANLVLANEEVPECRLGAGLPLGLATWLGKLDRDGDDLVVDLTRTV